MLTEQPNPKTQDIDRLTTLEIVQRINEEDHGVAQAVQQVLPQIAQAVDAVVERLQQGGRMIYIGAGTSGRLGVLDAVECVPTFNAPPGLIIALIAGGEQALTQAVEGAEDDPQAGVDDLKRVNLTEKDVVVGIAASGRTPYVLGAVRYADTLGALTVGIACNVPAPLLDIVDIPIGVTVGAEVITGSTRMKAGTAQKLILNMLSTATMIKRGKVYGNLMVDVQVTNEKLAQRAVRIVQQVTKLDEATARDLLHRANNQVKAAIVMHFRAVDYQTACRILDDHDGFLRPIIDE
ncbi:MAG: N-acetylmuramic acid 6-phosphate etherase [Phototrophicales bacterium]|nr:MAG: N-acetylmuramic acid 6-phosphate etherase [Phototrophicales bacterium]RMG74565.1 MAG: N-acetylmuramic acid 6-phosphate etherase [Chloroflexota bacterium]